MIIDQRILAKASFKVISGMINSIAKTVVIFIS
jgi:hypothetical protein